jgi:hypothetical protein
MPERTASVARMERQRNPGHRLAGGRVDPDCAPLALHPGYPCSRNKISRLFIHPLPRSRILPPSLPARGRCLDRPGLRGKGAAPAPVGARQARSPGGKRSRSSRGSPPPPLRHYDRSAQAAEKAWNGDLQTPCGSAGEARLYNASARPALPHPSSRLGHMSGRRIGHGRIANREQRKCVTSPLATHQQAQPAWTPDSLPPRAFAFGRRNG